MMGTNKSAESELHRWEETTLRKVIEKHPLRPGGGLTASLHEANLVSIPPEVGDIEKLGMPGEYPFVRGIHPTMYRGRLWTMRQYSGFGSAEQTNQRYHTLLDRGQTGLSVAFDLPTQFGLDSDDQRAAGEVGRAGVAVDSIEDFEILFRGIPLDQVSTSMTINSPAAVLLAMYEAVAERRGVKPERLRGTIQNDVLKEYIARKTYIFPPEPAIRLFLDVVEHCLEHIPQWNLVSVSGYHIREAGATASQEVAFTLANGVAYAEAARERGIDVDRFLGRTSFFFSAMTDVLEEAAKFRAARRLWARIAKERLGAKDPRSLLLRFHTHTAGSSLASVETSNNIGRVMLSALAAVLGGTQSLHTCSYDEALNLPSEDAAVTALRTQQVLAHESGVTATVDPLGGSYYVEETTDRIEREAESYLEEIDRRGGAIACIKTGYIESEIESSAYEMQRRIDDGSKPIVGVTGEKAEPPPATLLEGSWAEDQLARLAEVRQKRDGEEAASSLQKLEGAARGETNVMPAILHCVRSGATVGEICGILRKVFGEYRG